MSATYLSDIELTETLILQHYGIQGMKWGVRRYQNEDGTLTEAGKKRYSTDDSERKKKVAKAILIGTVSVAAVTTTAYLLHRYRHKNLDVVIKAGKNIQHMSRPSNPNELLNKPFYASYLKRDNKIYESGSFLSGKWDRKMTITPTSDIKIAGRRKAEKLYEQWKSSITDQTIKNRLGNPSYFSFNRNIYMKDLDRDLEPVYNSFFKYMSDHGYQAIKDMNDQAQSGIIAPIVLFGNLGDLSIKDIVKLTKK